MKWWMWAGLLGLGAVVYYYVKMHPAITGFEPLPTLVATDGRAVPVTNKTSFLKRAGIIA